MSKPEKIYLAGPMRGIRDFNFPAFHEAARKLRLDGYQVFNPAEIDEAEYGVGFAKSETGNLSDIPNFNLRDALKKDIDFILTEATTIALLPGWERSLGVAAELAVAKAIGLKIMYLL